MANNKSTAIAAPLPKLISAKIVPEATKAIIAVPNHPPITLSTPATLYTALSAPQALSAKDVPMATINVT